MFITNAVGLDFFKIGVKMTVLTKKISKMGSFIAPTTTFAFFF
ncbi:MAG: hypothetical protein WCP65_05530 [Bacteroidota bacterium]